MGAGEHFGAVDYGMLAVTVVASVAIGVYHGIKGNKTAVDFSMGSRSMTPFPVSLSLLATFLSANSILGYSGEVYAHGSVLAWSILGTALAIVFAGEVVLPVLHPLKLVSPNQYLEMRFGSVWLRRLSMTKYLVSLTVFYGLALYAPTLALAAVTPLSSTTFIWIMGVVGGLKAVVWADAFQMVLMTAGVLLVTVMSCVEVGGVQKVWQVAYQGGRTEGLEWYLEMRFGSAWLRRLAMGMRLVSVTMFMGLALYAPTLALAAVSPISSTTFIWIMGVVVTIYASFVSMNQLGGLKAVVWADAFQMVLMTAGVLLVTVMSCVEVGGVQKVLTVAYQGGRTEGLDISTDPRVRHTVWNVILLTLVSWGSHYSVAQASYQRVSSVATLSQAKR
ncbi:hypothetical protein HAZT_HAZT003614 [Hyalella azteca]|uniref:Sodium-dependent multivitamin transporter n=1 Tax=Hyalella azteca TaxID=294128 RepID=A0A6A0GTX8_HYAAZ|nr:hypothetical protein HAZT_HAZT003614 [Hyalella azteca]